MKKKLVIGVSIIFSVLLLAQTSAVLASKPEPISFEWYEMGLGVCNPSTPTIKTELLVCQGDARFVGDVENEVPFIYTESTLEFYKDAEHEDLKLTKYSVLCETRPTGDVTIMGKTGGLVILIEKRSRPDTSDTLWRWRIISGTGELANIRGRGTAEGAPRNLDFEGFVMFP